MPEIKHHFRAGRMNKDLDERLVPNGEYRDAQNIEIITSEGSDIGSIQNSLGNTLINGKKLNVGTKTVSNWSANFISELTNAKCIGYVVDNENNKIYWMIAATGVSCIAEYDDVTKEVLPVIVDKLNILKFSADYPITGINVIEGLLAWTDNQTDPKKINIEKFKSGSIDFDTQTTYNGTVMNSTQRSAASSFKNENITTIKLGPRNAPTLVLSSSKRNGIGTIAGGDTFSSFDFQSKAVGAEFSIDFSPTPVYLKDDVISLVTTQENLDKTTTTYDVSIKIIELLNNGNRVRAVLLNKSSSLPIGTLQYSADLNEGKALFEKKLVRFAYRWKYNDGEYSTFSPFSSVAFLPGTFSYKSDDGYNSGMLNTVRSIVVGGFTKPLDVDKVEVLLKESNSNSIYLTHTIADSSTSYTVESETLGLVIPSNQLLRPWDNVPLKAKAQETIGNRLVYANYVQGYNIEDINIPEISTTIKTESVSSIGTGEKSLKSERTYQLGVVYSDYFQRETPVFSSKKSSVHLDKSYAELKTSISATINTVPPDWATHYKYFLKETSNEYYNLALDRFYLAEDSSVWLSFPSSERNKISEERYITLKKKHDSNDFVKESAKYRILDIKNEAPESLTKEVRLMSSYKTKILDPISDKPSVNSSFFKFRGPTDVENPEFARSFNSIGYLSVTSYDSNGDEIGTTDKYKIVSGGINGESNGSGITTVYEVNLEEGFESKESNILGSSVFSANSVFKINIYQEYTSYKPEFSGRFFVKINRDKVLDDNVINSFTLNESKYTSTEKKSISIDSSSDFTVENKDVSGLSWTDTKSEANGDYNDLRILDNGHPTSENKSFSIILSGVDTGEASLEHYKDEDKINSFLSKIEKVGTYIQFSNAGGFTGGIYEITSKDVSADFRSSDTSKKKKTSGKRRRYTIGIKSVLDGGGYQDDFVINGTGSTGIITDISIVQKQIDYENDNLISENPAIFETEPTTSVDLDLYYEVSDPLFIVKPGMKIQNTQYSTKEVITGIGNSTSTDGIKSTVIYWSGNIPSTINTGHTYRIWSSDELYYQDVVATGTNSTTSITLSRSNKVHGFDNNIDWFNCYSFGTGVESNRIQDDFNAIYIDKGPIVSSTIDTRYKSDHKKSGLIFSGIINSISGVNDLNQFIQAEAITKELNPEYGSIQRLVARDTDLVTFCEDKVLRILANKDALYNADGNPQLTASNNVLGQTIPYLGEYGCGKFPQAICWYGYRMYFLDKARSCVLRLSRDGITNISEKGMGDWFNDNIPLSNSFLGTFDENKKCYNITLNNYTVSFDERVDGWTSFRSFIPEFGTSLNGLYYTFNQGLLYSHNNVVRNNFYGTGYQSSVNVLMNEVPSSIKQFKTLNYEGSASRVYTYNTDYSSSTNTTGWYANSLKTEKQTGSVKEFVDKEGLWSNFISGDTTSIDNLDAKEFSVQGVGSFASIAGDVAKTQVNVTKELTLNDNLEGKITILNNNISVVQNVNTTVSRDTEFTIVPAIGYSIAPGNFTGTGCTFTQTPDDTPNVICTLASTDVALTSDLSAEIEITQNTAIPTSTYSVSLSYETFEENTSTLSRVNTTTYSGGVVDTETTIIGAGSSPSYSLTFTPDDGFEFETAPTASVVYSNGGGGKNMYTITNDWDSTDKDGPVVFTVRYTFGSKNITGDKIVFVAKAIKEVTAAPYELTSVDISKINISKDGETRTIKIIGTPSSRFNIIRKKTWRSGFEGSIVYPETRYWWGEVDRWLSHRFTGNFTMPDSGVYTFQEIYDASTSYLDFVYRLEPGVDFSTSTQAVDNTPLTAIKYSQYNSSGVIDGNQFPGSNVLLADNTRNTNTSVTDSTTLSFASLPTFSTLLTDNTDVEETIVSWDDMPAGRLFFVHSISNNVVTLRENYRQDNGTFSTREVSVTVPSGTKITFSSSRGEFLIRQLPDGIFKVKLKKETITNAIATFQTGGVETTSSGVIQSIYSVGATSYAFHEPVSGSSKYLIHVEKTITGSSSYILSEVRNPQPEDFKYQRHTMSSSSESASGAVVVFSNVPFAIFVGSKVKYIVGTTAYEDVVSSINEARTEVTLTSRSTHVIPAFTAFLFNDTLTTAGGNWSFNIQNVNGTLNNTTTAGNIYTLSFDLEVSKYGVGTLITELDLDSLLSASTVGSSPTVTIAPSTKGYIIAEADGTADVNAAAFLSGHTNVALSSGSTQAVSGKGWVIGDFAGSNLKEGTNTGSAAFNSNQIVVTGVSSGTKEISGITISTLNITSPDYTNTWGTPRVDGNNNYYPARGASKIGFNWAGTLPTNIGSSDTVKIKFGVIKYSDLQ